jgi:hypothetical protein
MECLNSWTLHPISNPNLLVSDALEHFKKFDDPDLKCMLSLCWFVGIHMNSHRQIL